MRGKVVGFVDILLVLVLILSPQVILARGLAQTTSITVTAGQPVVIGNPLDPKRPFCNRKVYANCRRRPPPLPTTQTQP